MSNTARRGEPSTIADYEVFLAAQPDDTRWELIGGVIVTMTDPTENHGQIAMNLAAPMKAMLNQAGFRTYAGSMRVQGSEDRDGGDAAIPDIVVRCGPSGNRTSITDPVAVVEVLSLSTMDRDRGPKLAFYKTIATLHDIVLVYQDQMRVEHYRRTEEGWTFRSLTRPVDDLVFDRLDVRIALETIYSDVRVLRPVDPAEPAGPVR